MENYCNIPFFDNQFLIKIYFGLSTYFYWFIESNIRVRSCVRIVEMVKNSKWTTPRNWIPDAYSMLYILSMARVFWVFQIIFSVYVVLIKSQCGRSWYTSHKTSYENPSKRAWPSSWGLPARGENGTNYFRSTNWSHIEDEKRIWSNSWRIRSPIRLVVNGYRKGYGFINIHLYPKIYPKI
jgi:hypothetical protein